jgi:hypothetical protein
VLGSLLLLSAAVVSGNGAPDHDTSKGASLLRGCQAEVRLMELNSLADAPQMDLINGAYCIGYLNGFMGAPTSGQSSVCLHGESLGAVVRTYVTFMERNPALLDEEKRVGLQQALHASYPCPSQH